MEFNTKDLFNNIKKIETKDGEEYKIDHEIGSTTICFIEAVLSSSGVPIMYLLLNMNGNIIFGIPSCNISKIFF